ncbi:hypothetical protein CTAYLR_005284 [Chrysophaeum taylorii]|uniref:Fe2OG dioxygenase domain-containing protein n=1 Tax=Chrysophaeum taylorii TaxID=2483200 RepID=A0AAD7UKY2_9STRA|nr:hypothetical protein CTAYLR_005284 [Chrysophaeum taylorii]
MKKNIGGCWEIPPRAVERRCLRGSGFVFFEDGTNILEGLTLHREAIDARLEAYLVDWIDEQLRNRKALLGATFLQSTYTVPEGKRLVTRKGRQVLQYGSYYDYREHAIDSTQPVEEMPAQLNRVIDELTHKGALPRWARPDTCIVNVYEAGSGISPHVDDVVYPRPFCTVSFLSDSPIFFGTRITPLGGNRFGAPVAVDLPRRSVLVLDGVAANVTKHCIPPVNTRRISLTFRRMPEHARRAVAEARLSWPRGRSTTLLRATVEAWPPSEESRRSHLRNPRWETVGETLLSASSPLPAPHRRARRGTPPPDERAFFVSIFSQIKALSPPALPVSTPASLFLAPRTRNSRRVSNLMSSLRWKLYLGEEADEAESEDEDYLGGRSSGYTHDDMIARTKKLAAVEAFEEARRKGLVEIVRPPSHRNHLAASVRPRVGEEVIFSYRASRGEETLASGERIVARVGSPTNDDRRSVAIDRELRDMRRGEKIRFEDDGTTIEVELHVVCEERAVTRASSPWASRRDGSARKRRLECGRGLPRPTWGDTVVVRVLEAPPADAHADAIALALEEEKPREVALGSGVEREGFETGLLAMKRDELAIVSASGEFCRSEAGEEKTSCSEWTAAVRLLEIRKKREQPSIEEAEAVARDLKRRGGVLAGMGRWRGAEALYTRALRHFDQATFALSDGARDNLENDLVVPLLLNIAVCARKRAGHQDEEALVTKALRLRHAPDAAFKAKAYVRRAAARVDLAKWDEAKEDLQLAADNAKRADAKPVLKDVQRQLARLSDLRKAERAAKTKQYAGAKAAFCDVVEVTDDDDDGSRPRAHKAAPLLYEKEIDDRLKAQKPWEYDPDYHKIKHAPRQPLQPEPAVLKEDNLKDQYKAFDEEDEKHDKAVAQMRQNWVMNQMYDTNGTGRRGMKPKGGGGGSMFEQSFTHL